MDHGLTVSLLITIQLRRSADFLLKELLLETRDGCLRPSQLGLEVIESYRGASLDRYKQNFQKAVFLEEFLGSTTYLFVSRWWNLKLCYKPNLVSLKVIPFKLTGKGTLVASKILETISFPERRVFKGTISKRDYSSRYIGLLTNKEELSLQMLSEDPEHRKLASNRLNDLNRLNERYSKEEIDTLAQQCFFL